MKKKLKLYAVLLVVPPVTMATGPMTLIAHKSKKLAITHYMGILDMPPETIGVAKRVKVTEPGRVEIPDEIRKQLHKELHRLAPQTQLAD